jgi:hypothetical protein
MDKRKLWRLRLLTVAMAASIVVVMPTTALGKSPATAAVGLPSTQLDQVGSNATAGQPIQPGAAYWNDFNVWACHSEAQNPHLSGHYNGTVAAVALHTCAGYRGSNYLISTYPDWQTMEGWLYYESCFLLFCGWNQVDHWYSGTVTSDVSIYLTHTLAANCSNGNSTRWRLYGHGQSHGFNGSQIATWQSYVENIQTLGCGR